MCTFERIRIISCRNVQCELSQFDLEWYTELEEDSCLQYLLLISSCSLFRVSLSKHSYFRAERSVSIRKTVVLKGGLG